MRNTLGETMRKSCATHWAKPCADHAQHTGRLSNAASVMSHQTAFYDIEKLGKTLSSPGQSMVAHFEMIIIVELKGSVQDCFQSPHCALSYLLHACSHSQDAMLCKWCATHRALITHSLCCATWWGGTTHQLILTELKSLSFVFHWLKQWAKKGGMST